MGKDVLLSILIATKNRQKYCFSAVESILSIKSQNIEVVVQDNSDDESLSLMLDKLKRDSRLIYQYTPPPFSSIDNFNAAISLANGEYVCLIGDDDGINPEIIEATLWAKENNIDALSCNVIANYRWEGTGAPDTLFTKMTGSTLTITHFEGKVYEADPEKSLLKLMKNGCTNYLEFDFPKLYHGIVRRKCLEEIKMKTDEYLKGLSPDIYSAICLACVVNRLVIIDYPLTIPGQCAQSTSISEGQVKKHSKRLEDAPHFRDRGPYTWSPEVPRIYCVQTIWADSGFAALREMKRQDLIDKFDRYSLYANIVAADKSLTAQVKMYMESLNNGKKIKFSESLNLFFGTVKGPIYNFLVNRALSRFKIIVGIKRLDIIGDLPTISEAMHALAAYLKKSKTDMKTEFSKFKY